ncbi:hypothetical protein FNF27_07747 [Cafeteria roenbergensis]|uniref:Uncharacterized protein n=1 Tax=Cafeteria roenbergensis TaxID=33653 RepID=A0A5A8DI93_CAFRO|nr:hypothetical protein FNF27_07747 [Cafeteria roenbergensis]
MMGPARGRDWPSGSGPDGGAGPPAALTPKVRLFGAPLWSQQGVAAWACVSRYAVDSGQLGQLEAGIRQLLESTPAASAALGVPFQVARADGRAVAPHELPPGHHPAHSCAKVGLVAGGAYSGVRFSSLRGEAVQGLPPGYDDVVDMALSTCPVAVFRTVLDDVTQDPIYSFINHAMVCMCGVQHLDGVAFVNSGRNSFSHVPRSKIAHTRGLMYACARKQSSFRHKGEYVRLSPSAWHLPPPLCFGRSRANELVNLTYGPTGGLRTITSFYFDIEHLDDPVLPGESVGLASLFGSVVARSPMETMEAVAALGANKLAFDMAVVKASSVAHLPTWTDLATAMTSPPVGDDSSAPLPAGGEASDAPGPAPEGAPSPLAALEHDHDHEHCPSPAVRGPSEASADGASLSTGSDIQPRRRRSRLDTASSLFADRRSASPLHHSASAVLLRARADLERRYLPVFQQAMPNALGCRLRIPWASRSFDLRSDSVADDVVERDVSAWVRRVEAAMGSRVEQLDDDDDDDDDGGADGGDSMPVDAGVDAGVAAGVAAAAVPAALGGTRAHGGAAVRAAAPATAARGCRLAGEPASSAQPDLPWAEPETLGGDSPWLLAADAISDGPLSVGSRSSFDEDLELLGLA